MRPRSPTKCSGLRERSVGFVLRPRVQRVSLPKIDLRAHEMFSTRGKCVEEHYHDNDDDDKDDKDDKDSFV